MEYINMRAYAKINLGLDVLGTLDNGYHEVRMVMQNIDMFDKVNIFKNNSGRITVKTNLSFLPTGADNLVYRAADLLIKEFGITAGVDIDLFKFIPVAAGMAGGSSDAAAVLRGMNTLFGLNLSMEELMKRGAMLGADIPYCIMGGTALAEGIGDRLTRLNDCPSCYVVVGKPAISVSTKYVYDNLVLDDNTKHPDIDGMILAIKEGRLYDVADRLGNVLETVTETKYPVITGIKEDMMDCGALNAIMSGSGPTVFGLFDDKDEADKCNEYLRRGNRARISYVTELINGGMA
ncbi:MAG: 4-(cytidine 5'-diphospho)-2-C-methyl-D-erythritol kinase [Butyrivibrio sp.]